MGENGAVGEEKRKKKMKKKKRKKKKKEEGEGAVRRGRTKTEGGSQKCLFKSFQMRLSSFL